LGIDVEKWFGTIDELKTLVEGTGVTGTWEQRNNHWCFRGTRRQVLDWYPTTNKVLVQGQDSETFSALLNKAASGSLQSEPSRSKGNGEARIFVVHGHDTHAREQLELVLMKLGLQPFILMNAHGGGRTIIEALEHQIYENAAFGIVLMTPDDYGYPKTKTDADRQPRARQSVILEAGMILAALGRSRMAVLKKGALETPSDLDGLLRLEFNEHVKEIVPKLAQSIIDAGIPIDQSKIAHAAS
jgi:predicted nucleotide-binding protein